MIYVVVPPILALLATCIDWIVERGFRSSLQNKAMWFFSAWCAWTVIFFVFSAFFATLL